MKRAIITGATGAIGTALINELIKNGVEVLVLCRKGSPRNEQIPNHELVTVDYCTLSELKDLQNTNGKTYDVFYHFAWEGTTGEARNDMILQNRNVEYAIDAVNTAKRFGCHTFIGAGSQAEYGRVDGVLKPDTPCFPENGYGMAKLCAGHMTRIEAEKLNLRHIWVRVLSVYGLNDGQQSMVMSTISKLKKGETPNFTLGEQKWDYLYSIDAAKAFYMLALKGVKSKTYVLGSGCARPLAEYIRDIRDAVNSNAKINLGAIPYAQNQVMHLCADITELKNDTGWHPKYSFKEGINELVK